jgi:hypothetical protein
LRTGPSAKNPSEYDSEKNDEYNESEKSDCEDEKILRPENLSKENKLTLHHIEHEERLFIHCNKRERKEDDKINDRSKGTEVVEFTLGFFRKNIITLALFTDSRN